MNEPLLYEDLILLDYYADNQNELLLQLADVLHKKGFVKESYAEAILQREKEYATGLNTMGIKVAIPHTYPVHVLKPAILVAKLSDPVLFKEMGDGQKDVEAKLIFMLAVTDPEEHLETLSKLMTIFSDGDKLLDLYQTKSAAAMVGKLSEILN
jgi:PTS system galactitol-specific IIA component